MRQRGATTAPFQRTRALGGTTPVRSPRRRLALPHSRLQLARGCAPSRHRLAQLWDKAKQDSIGVPVGEVFWQIPYDDYIAVRVPNEVNAEHTPKVTAVSGRSQPSIDASSPIRWLPPKRAHSAMEATTVRLALETTIERRRKRASQWRWRLIAPRSRVALDPVGLILADVEPPRRDQLGVGGPVVRAVEARVPALQAGEEPFER